MTRNELKTIKSIKTAPEGNHYTHLLLLSWDLVVDLHALNWAGVCAAGLRHLQHLLLHTQPKPVSVGEHTLSLLITTELGAGPEILAANDAPSAASVSPVYLHITKGRICRAERSRSCNSET